MKSIKKILIALLVVTVILFAFYAYFGGFNKLNFKIEKAGGETVVYKQMVGDYSKSGEMMKSITEELSKDYGITTTQNFGIYYSDPEKTDKNNLRSDIGCIVNTSDQNKMEELQKTYTVKQLPVKDYLITKMPFRGLLSVMIGIFRVYPAMDEYIKENNISNCGPITEIYDSKNKVIIYRKELSSKEDKE